MGRDHNSRSKLWSSKTDARALQPWRRVVEMEESRTPRMASALVLHHVSVSNFPTFLPLRSSPVFVLVRSRRGRIGGKCAKHTIFDLREQARQCGRSWVRPPNGGLSIGVYRDVNRTSATPHAGTYSTPINSRCVWVPHYYVPAACPVLPRSLDILSPRWAVLPPSWLARGVTRLAAAPERERVRHERATLQAPGSLVACARASEGGDRAAERWQAGGYSLPSDLRQIQYKDAGGAPFRAFACGGSGGIRAISKHTCVTGCSCSHLASSCLHG
jgi:hypothetical protein